jgi:hypothetical protein
MTTGADNEQRFVSATDRAEQTERALDFLAAEQDQDGGWPVRWRDWAPGTRLEWRPIVTIEALRTLHAYGRGI